MNVSNRRGFVVGVAAGVCLATGGAVLLAQQQPTPTIPPPSSLQASEYFVTGDEKTASLWMRDGSSIRFVAEGKKSDRGKVPDTTKRNDQ